MRPGRLRLLSTAITALMIGTMGVGIANAHSVPNHLSATRSAGLAVHPMGVNGTAIKSHYVAGWTLSSAKVISDVKGSWIVPRVHGTCGSATTEASFYIGIEGYYGSTYTFAAIGVTIGCSGGSVAYAAWYQFSPYAGLVISSMKIHPGDYIFAHVSASSATHWVLKLSDLNTSTTLWKNFGYPGGRTGVDWLVGVTTSGGVPIYKLTNFGTVHFGRLYTMVNKTSGATIGGVVGSIAYAVNHGALATVSTMVKYTGTTVMATPSSIKSDGRSFTVTWKSAGP